MANILFYLRQISIIRQGVENKYELIKASIEVFGIAHPEMQEKQMKNISILNRKIQTIKNVMYSWAGSLVNRFSEDEQETLNAYLIILGKEFALLNDCKSKLDNLLFHIHASIFTKIAREGELLKEDFLIPSKDWPMTPAFNVQQSKRKPEDEEEGMSSRLRKRCKW